MEVAVSFLAGIFASFIIFFLLNRYQEKKLIQWLNPLKDRLDNYQNFINHTHQADIRERTQVKEQIQNLLNSARLIEKETHQLSQALSSDVKFQGDWGEMVLERVLELSGLKAGREFELQKQFEWEGKVFRPDAIVHLPQNSHLIIDSKVSLRAYFDFLDSGEEQALKSLKKSLKSHIDELGAKNYPAIAELETPDFVYLFIPVEGIFSEILKNFPELIDQALRKNIILVSPVNLMASLKTVAALWRLDKQSKNAVEIASQAGAMYDKFYLLLQDMQKLRSQFNRLDKSFEDIEQRLETGKGSLIHRANQLKESGARASKDIAH